MKLVRNVIVFDAADLTAESSFWAGIFGGYVFEDEAWHSVVDADGEWRIGVQLAPNHVPPEWPHGVLNKCISTSTSMTPSRARRGNLPRRPPAPAGS